MKVEDFICLASITGDAFGKQKAAQPLKDITNRQLFTQLHYTNLESCGHASSSQSEAQSPNLLQQKHLQLGLSTSNVETNYLLPDLNMLPLLPEIEDVNIDGDVAENKDATESEDDYEEPHVGYGIIDNEEYWDIGNPTYECEYCGAYF
ncbi:PREDICTED: uncharacterized protein LOC109221817, partial [Nicotiana attenuata]|uniref:uncharacterized protein LOC109221817 n=1 Tax=Nicotiana attenuata TaxID=49451 RepID=UPI000904BCE3